MGSPNQSTVWDDRYLGSADTCRTCMARWVGVIGRARLTLRSCVVLSGGVKVFVARFTEDPADVRLVVELADRLGTGTGGTLRNGELVLEFESRAPDVEEGSAAQMCGPSTSASPIATRTLASRIASCFLSSSSVSKSAGRVPRQRASASALTEPSADIFSTYTYNIRGPDTHVQTCADPRRRKS